MLIVGSSAGGETIAHVLFILETQIRYTTLEQQVIGREGEGPGSSHSCDGR